MSIQRTVIARTSHSPSDFPLSFCFLFLGFHLLNPPIPNFPLKPKPSFFPYMAFPRWSGDVRLPSAADDTYFTAQARQAGYPVEPIARSDLAAPPPFSAREVLQRELQKERIREEYLSRELAHSRLLLDQQMRHQQELEAVCRFVPAPAYPSVVPEFRAVERLPAPHPVELGFRERLPPPVPRLVDAGFDRRRPRPRSKSAVRERHSAALRPKAAIRKQRPGGRGADREDEGELLKKASGIKKTATIEAASDPPSPAASDPPSQAASDPPSQDKSKWSCSLCQVFATSDRDLKVHLNGRRHKVKQESHSSQIKVAGQVVPADGSKKVDKPLSGKPTQEEQNQSFYCDVCKVKCTSQSMLDSHLNGKRHKEASVTSPAKETGTSKEVLAPLPVKEQKQPDQQKQAVKKMLAVKQTSAFKPNQSVQNSLHCDVCNLQCNSQFMLNSHLNGKKHQAQLMRRNKAQGDTPVSAEDNKLANDMQHGKAQDGKPVTAEGPKLANDKPVVTAEQTGEDNMKEGSGKGDIPITTKENIFANNEPVVSEQSGKDKSLVTTDSSGQDGKPVISEESGKALTPVLTTKRTVVKKVREQSAAGNEAVEEPVKTGLADTQVSLGAMKMEQADTEVSIVGSVAAETTENVQ